MSDSPDTRPLTAAELELFEALVSGRLVLVVADPAASVTRSAESQDGRAPDAGPAAAC